MTYAVPKELAERRQWVAWRTDVRDGRPTKVPINPHTGHLASTTDPETWGSYEEAVNAADLYELNAQLGFVLTADDPIVGIDLDKCVSRDPPSVADWALNILNLLNGYAEFSPSRTGLHILVRGELPAGHRSRAESGAGKIEVYTHSRFLTFTAEALPGSTRDIPDRQAALAEFYANVFPDPGPDLKAPLPLAVPPLRIGDRLRILVERGWHEGCGFPSASELDYAVASEMLKGGYSEAEVVWVFKTPVFGFSRGKHRRDDYIQRTVAAAKAALPAATPTRRLRSFTLADAAREDWPIPMPVVDRLVYPQSVTLIAGPPKVGKTFLVMQLLASIASGRAFMGEFIVPEALRCLHFTAETPDAYYWHRWRSHFDPLFQSVRANIRFSTEKGLGVVEDYGAIADLVNSTKPAVVVFDTWIRYHDADENDAAEMKQAMTQIDRLIETFNLSVIIVHHTRKAAFEEVADAMSLIRGTGVLRSHPNVNVVMLPSKAEYDEGTVKQVRITVESNFDPPFDPFMVVRGEGGLFERAQAVDIPAAAMIRSVLQGHEGALAIPLLHKIIQQDYGIAKGIVMKALHSGRMADVKLEQREGREWAVLTTEGGQNSGQSQTPTDAG